MNTVTKKWHKSFWRIQFGYFVYIHHYDDGSTRYVFKPEFIYDSKVSS